MLDENSKRIVDNVVKEDDILNQNIASTIANYPTTSVQGLIVEQILNGSRKSEI